MARAVNVKERRVELQYIHVTSDFIAGTDGKNLHFVPNDGNMQPGFYNTAGDRVHDENAFNYPDWQRILPDMETAVAVEVDTARNRREKAVVPDGWTERGIDPQKFALATNGADQATVYCDGAKDACFVISDKQPAGCESVVALKRI